MADKKESEMNQASDFQYVRGLDPQGNSVNIDRSEFLRIINLAKILSLEPGQEAEIYPNLYGLYQIDDYSSGSTAIYLASYNNTFLIQSLGVDLFGTSPGDKTLSFYKKEGNSPLYLSNNSEDAHSVGFKRL
ncbi:MAG: hypothetical protein LBU37_09570 [Tannerellaceae bacterium]|jgi:hypothetical protein|nr:hypothetical protein [Tannerellaceae bacterium]